MRQPLFMNRNYLQDKDFRNMRKFNQSTHFELSQTDWFYRYSVKTFGNSIILEWVRFHYKTSSNFQFYNIITFTAKKSWWVNKTKLEQTNERPKIHFFNENKSISYIPNKNKSWSGLESQTLGSRDDHVTTRTSKLLRFNNIASNKSQ